MFFYLFAYWLLLFGFWSHDRQHHTLRCKTENSNLCSIIVPSNWIYTTLTCVFGVKNWLINLVSFHANFPISLLILRCHRYVVHFNFCVEIHWEPKCEKNRHPKRAKWETERERETKKVRVSEDNSWAQVKTTHKFWIIAISRQEEYTGQCNAHKMMMKKHICNRKYN